MKFHILFILLFSLTFRLSGQIVQGFETYGGDRNNARAECWSFSGSELKSGIDISGSYYGYTGTMNNPDDSRKFGSPWIKLDGTGDISFKYKVNSTSSNPIIRLVMTSRLDSSVVTLLNTPMTTSIDNPSIDLAGYSGVYRFEWVMTGSGGHSRGYLDDIIIDGNDVTDLTTNNGAGECDCYAPVVRKDSIAIQEDDPLTLIDILENDTTLALAIDSSSIKLVAGPKTSAIASINVSKELEYTTGQDYFGIDTLEYEICDESGVPSFITCSSNYIIVNVLSVNDNPVAVIDSAILDEDGSTSDNVYANISDVDHDNSELTLTFLNETDLNGSVTLSGNNIDYIPDADYFGYDTLIYAISDPEGGADTSMLVLKVNPVNDPPVAEMDSALLDEDGNTVHDVFENIHDVDDADSTLTISFPDTSNLNGSINYADGNIAYTPDGNYFGHDTLVYIISDPSGASDTSMVVFQVSPVNDAPVAEIDSALLDEDGNTVHDVFENIHDVDDADSTLTISFPDTSNLNGSINYTDGNIAYTPDENYYGNDTLVYIISDPSGAADTSMVVFQVSPINDAPVAEEGSALLDEDGSTVHDVFENIHDVDDADSTLTISFPDTSNLNGTINYTDGNIAYTPDENYYGNDTLVYIISDPSGAADTSMVVFQVQSGNDVPVVLGNTFTSTEDEQNTIDLLELIQDDGPDSLLLVEQVNEDLTRGEISIDDGMITYTPQPNYFGNDTIYYQVSDTGGNQVDSFLIVEIEPVNDSPEAGTIYIELGEDDESKMIDLLQNASDVDNDTTDLAVSEIIYTSGKGTVSRFGDSINYIPGDGIAGTDTIIYVIEDPDGLVDTSIVVITLAPGLELFTAVNDTLEILEDTEEFLIDVLANDQFGFLANIELVLLSEKSTNLGSVSVNNKQIIYDPIPDLYGDELLTYQIKNNDGDSATANIVLNILPVNDAPEASDDYFREIDASSEILLDVLANDNDIDNGMEDLTIADIDPTTLKGQVEVSNNQIRYTPPTEYHETDSFMYFINDGELLGSAMVYIHFAEEEIQDPELLISQGVSPNGDGINDKWIISGIEYYPVNKVMIFNRWGDQVASYEGYDNQVTVWKGESQRVFNWETELPDGTYFYVIEIGVGTVFKGSVELRK